MGLTWFFLYEADDLSHAKDSVDKGRDAFCARLPAGTLLRCEFSLVPMPKGSFDNCPCTFTGTDVSYADTFWVRFKSVSHFFAKRDDRMADSKLFVSVKVLLPQAKHGNFRCARPASDSVWTTTPAPTPGAPEAPYLVGNA